eukprot:COSAG02_NODE_58566_length_277_cov_0.573034_1_plen_92_part_11
MAGALLYLYVQDWRRQRAKSQRTLTGLMSAAHTDNPLSPDPDSSQVSLGASASCLDIRVIARVFYQPVRILVGYFQVVTQIGPVLHLDFPPG